MNTQMLQSIRLMELPILELREKIGEELEKNPALEVLKDTTTVSLDNSEKPQKEEEEFFENISGSDYVSKGKAASDEKQRFLEGAITQSETLQEHLLWQLRLEPVDEEIRQICELLIQNLDDDGFHREPVNVLLSGVESEKTEKALKVVQGLDPAGTCTSGYLESLVVQIGLLPDMPKGIEEALSHLLEKGRTGARKTGSEEAILEKIKELSPFPGRRFSAAETRFVIPDIQVIKKEGEFAIILNEEEIPVLGINPFFMKIAGNAVNNSDAGEKRKNDKPVRDFARENIREARWFINSINQRNHTLLRVSRAIVEFQRPFFTNGPKYLAPLTLKDIAEELALHETTVSRTANGKFVQTEWGIFELRYFFSNSITGTGSGGSKFSKEGVKEIIKEIIESGSGRFSDKDIAELLSKKGITLARRTVAKYRNELERGSFVR
jgi:RNA polymerase sigma-54 factor